MEREEKQTEKLLEEQQIIRLEKRLDEEFISPVVTIVMIVKSIKIALDLQELNNVIHKNKYQKQSIDHLIGAVAKYISERSKDYGTFHFSRIELKYAYSQIPLDPQLQKHRRKGNRKIPERLLRTNRYAGNIPKTYRHDIKKQPQEIRIPRRYIGNRSRHHSQT